MVVADAAGTAASAAAITNAKSESLKLLLHTTVPPLGSDVDTTSGDCQNPTKIVQASLGNNTESTVIPEVLDTQMVLQFPAENLFLLG